MIRRELMAEVIEYGLKHGADYVEFFGEDNIKNTIVVENGLVEGAITGRDYGVGLRLFKGTNQAYTYTSDCSRDNLLYITGRAAASLGGQEGKGDFSLHEGIAVNKHPILIVPSSVSNDRKVVYLKRIHRAAKEYSPEIRHVTVRHWEMDRKRTIATSDGLVRTDRSVYTRFFIKTVASDGQENQTGFLRPGGLIGMELYRQYDIEEYARQAARTAVTMLHAGSAPAGVMPVVIEKGSGGVFLHEAVGHSLESSSTADGGAIYSGKLKQKIGHEKFTMIDDGTLPNHWGSINIDDEGIAATKNILVEKGVLMNYMCDRMGARKLGMKPTGAGRRESYRYAPTARMTNTYIAPGFDEEADIIASVDYGLYAKEIGGGTANTVTSDFNFNVLEGYMIRNGKICEPVRGATITGRAVEAIFHIDRVGKKLDFGQGMCGAASGSLPVNSGQPMIRVKRMTVGGK